MLKEGGELEVNDEEFVGDPGVVAPNEDTSMEAEDTLQGGQPVEVVEERVATALRREQELETTRRRRGLLDDVPHALKKARMADGGGGQAETYGGGDPARASAGPPATSSGNQEVFMAARRCSERGCEKQLEKEIPWSLIPPDEKQLYRDAELTQWQEHLQYEAVRPLTKAESEEVRATVDPSRILRSRFAYRDKHHALRKAQPELPPKPKARLCVSGQFDPDLTKKEMSVDVPTAGRQSLLLAVQVALAKDWVASIGDIRAAFLNGVQAPRQLYFELPKRGIPTVEDGILVEILKGVFGLSTSPKLWWLRLSGELRGLEVDFRGEAVDVKQNDMDPCIFMFIGRTSGQVHGVILTHVDDLLLLTDEGLRPVLQAALSAKFPVDKWTNDRFEYIGCNYDFSAGRVVIAQESYAETRLEEITLFKDQKDEDDASREQVEENRTAIGSLSWLAKQTRPDLQFGVSTCQRRQNHPSVADLKETNKLVREAKAHKEKNIVLRKINPDDLALYAFHDAAWGNVESPTPEDGDEQWYGEHKLNSQLAHIIIAASKTAILGQEGAFSVIDWT